jgi:hypothetical protein
MAKVTEVRLNPELQDILFNLLPRLIDFCEREGRRLAKQIIAEIKEEIALQPEQREQIILSHRNKYVNRYKELITSGLRLKATDKEEIIQKIGLIMFSSGTWKIPLPKDCAFSSLQPDPKGHIQTAIAPLFNHYAIIEACNELLKPDEPTGTTGTQNPEQETTEQKIKQILEPLRLKAFDDKTHIDMIIEAFIKNKAGKRLPDENKAVLKMDMKEFIKPFGRLFAEGLFRRGDISQTLLFYIEKNTFSGNPEYNQGYIDRLLSEYKMHLKRKSNTKV